MMSAIGILYLTGTAGFLLPRREGVYQQTDKYLLADYLGELRVKKDSPLIGETWQKGKLKDMKGVSLIKIIRGKQSDLAGCENKNQRE